MSEQSHEASNDQNQSRQHSDDHETRSNDGGQQPTIEVRGEKEATVIVRGASVSALGAKSDAKNAQGGDIPQKKSNESQSQEKDKDLPKAVSESKVKMQNRLPALDDDQEVGVQKPHAVTRDGKADLSFNGTLLASAAPSSAPKGEWQEYRIFETDGGKHVFSKSTRSIYAEEDDAHEAEVFEPTPSSMPSQLLRSARDLTRSRPLSWNDAAVDFFGYDPLAKALYRKLSGQFEEHIS